MSEFFNPEEEIDALVGPMRMAGILLHEVMVTFEETGFTRAEAFELVRLVMIPKLAGG